MTKMAQEIASIPEVVARQIEVHLSDYRSVGERLRAADPSALITCARGSSDHAALYLKYLLETSIGLPVCSMGPSLGSVFDAPLKVRSVPLVAISQSGGSADISALTKLARDAGGMTFALLNETDSPLGRTAQTTIPMAAGPEIAVAATKSFVCSLTALAAIAAFWMDNKELVRHLEALPEALSRALTVDWSSAGSALQGTSNLFVVSRGLGLSVAEEAALKFKETCNLHAEAFSAAEVLHGPVALADARFSALAFGTRDASGESVKNAVDFMRKAGARVLVVGTGSGGSDELPAVDAPDPRLDPIVQIVCFYRLVEHLSIARGLNPDAPALLKKVTVTQ